MNQSVEIQIDELILHGFSPADRFKIGQAVRSELARMFMERGLPQQFSNGGNVSGMDGGTFTMSKNMSARTIGSKIAQSVYGGLGK